MSQWFRVPGQDCPVALGGVPCETNLDCQMALSHDTSCQSLLPYQTAGLGWSNGGISSSSAGTLKCDPFRKTCGMVEKYEKNETNTSEIWGGIGVL